MNLFVVGMVVVNCYGCKEGKWGLKFNEGGEKKESS